MTVICARSVTAWPTAASLEDSPLMAAAVVSSLRAPGGAAVRAPSASTSPSDAMTMRSRDRLPGDSAAGTTTPRNRMSVPIRDRQSVPSTRRTSASSWMPWLVTVRCSRPSIISAVCTRDSQLDASACQRTIEHASRIDERDGRKRAGDGADEDQIGKTGDRTGRFEPRVDRDALPLRGGETSRCGVDGNRAVRVGDERQPSLRIIVCDDARHADAAAGLNAAGFDLRQQRFDFVAVRRSSRRRARAARGGAAQSNATTDQNPVAAVRGHTPCRGSTGPQAIH